MKDVAPKWTKPKWCPVIQLQNWRHLAHCTRAWRSPVPTHYGSKSSKPIHNPAALLIFLSDHEMIKFKASKYLSKIWSFSRILTDALTLGLWDMPVFVDAGQSFHFHQGYSMHRNCWCLPLSYGFSREPEWFRHRIASLVWRNHPALYYNSSTFNHQQDVSETFRTSQPLLHPQSASYLHTCTTVWPSYWRTRLVV